jgi:hypothetical protein
MLVTKKIIDAKKKNALSKKSPIVDEEAIKRAQAEADAKAKAEADRAEAARVAAETPVEEVASETEVATETAQEETATA